MLGVSLGDWNLALLLLVVGLVDEMVVVVVVVAGVELVDELDLVRLLTLGRGFGLTTLIFVAELGQETVVGELVCICGLVLAGLLLTLTVLQYFGAGGRRGSTLLVVDFAVGAAASGCLACCEFALSTDWAYRLTIVLLGLLASLVDGLSILDVLEALLLLDSFSKTARAVMKRETLLSVRLRPVRWGDEPLEPLTLVQLSLNDELFLVSGLGLLLFSLSLSIDWAFRFCAALSLAEPVDAMVLCGVGLLWLIA